MKVGSKNYLKYIAKKRYPSDYISRIQVLEQKMKALKTIKSDELVTLCKKKSYSLGLNSKKGLTIVNQNIISPEVHIKDGHFTKNHQKIKTLLNSDQVYFIDLNNKELGLILGKQYGTMVVNIYG